MPPANQADQTAVGRPAEIPGVRAIRGLGVPGDSSALFSARGPVPAAGASSVPHEHRPVFTKRPRRAPTPAFLRFGSFSRRAPRAADFGRRGDAGLRWGRAGGDGLGPSRRGRRSTAAARGWRADKKQPALPSRSPTASATANRVAAIMARRCRRRTRTVALRRVCVSPLRTRRRRSGRRRATVFSWGAMRGVRGCGIAFSGRTTRNCSSSTLGAIRRKRPTNPSANPRWGPASRPNSAGPAPPRPGEGGRNGLVRRTTPRSRVAPTPPGSPTRARSRARPAGRWTGRGAGARCPRARVASGGSPATVFPGPPTPIAPAVPTPH